MQKRSNKLGRCVPQFYCSTLIYLVLLLTSVSSYPQSMSFLKNLDEVEVAFGPSSVSLYNDNTTKGIRKIKVGYTGSIGMLYSLNEAFFLNTKFLIERKGLKTRYDVWYYDQSIDINNCKCTMSLGVSENNSNLDYLTFATPLRFNFKKIPLVVEGGPFISYLLKAKGTVTQLWDNKQYYYNNMEYNKRIDGGLSVSVGYKISIKDHTTIVLQLMDNIGLLNIADSNATKTNTTTNSLSFLLGLNYRIH